MTDEDDQYRAALAQYTDPHLRTYTSVPPHRAGICDVCHNAPGVRYDGTPWARCMSCGWHCSHVQHPVLEVIPISLYVEFHQLHTVLRGYKDSSSQKQRDAWTVQVAAMIGRFMEGHRRCVESAVGAWDTIGTVPSKRRPDEPHPLDRAIDMLGGFYGERVTLLGPGLDPITRRKPADHGFEPLPAARGKRVLLADDTYASGSKLQSAGSALTRGGATVVGALVVGRIIDPDFTEQAAELWERARRRPFSFNVCCLCDAPW